MFTSDDDLCQSPFGGYAVALGDEDWRESLEMTFARQAGLWGGM